MAFLKNLFGRGGGSSAPGPEPAQARPSAADLRSRGNAALAAGDFAQARDLYAEAASADPQDALARVNLGFVLLESGDLARAQAQLLDALALCKPEQNNRHEIQYFLGRCFRAQGDAERALQSFEAAVATVPVFAEAMEEIVQMLHESGAYAEALEWSQRLHAARPTADSSILIAHQLHRLHRNEEALAVLDEVVKQEPGHAGAWTGRGTILAATGRDAEAVVAFERAVALSGPTPDALANLAGALAGAGRYDDALQRADAALQREPTHRDAMYNRLGILLGQLRVEDAVQAGREAVAAYSHDADIHWNLAIAQLLTGRFDEGWREHEWRWRATASRAKHPLTQGGAQWTGAEDLQGRSILLFAEQGLGDTLQMLRYVPLVAARGARVVLSLPAALHGLVLVSDLAPGVTLWPPGEPLPAHDLYCPLMSLPLAFGANEATIPRDVPYFKLDGTRVDAWRRRLGAAGQRFKVGVVWFGSATHANDANRSIPLAAFRGLGVDECFFVSLQQEMRDSDRPALGDWPQLHRWGEELVDFDDTAALVSALDLVITVDTSVAHLAGALGRPVWVMLPHLPDWRWMLGRADSTWYPTARLFRQPRRQDWAGVLDEVRRELEQAAAKRNSAGAQLGPVIAPNPSWPALLQRAQEEISRGDPAAALATLQSAEDQAGPHPSTGQLRGNALFALGRHAEAGDAYDAARSRKPGLHVLASNAAASWYRAGRMDLALARAEEALRSKPDDVASLLLRANALQLLGRHDEAIAAARAAHEKFPHDADIEWTYGAIALAAGECDVGWARIESRWRLPGAGAAPDALSLRCPAWTGAEPVGGRTLLLVGEQGFGDVFQFVRYAAELRRRGARVVLLVREPVAALLRTSMPDCLVITRLEDGPRADFHIALMSLPGALRTTLSTIPADVPYLRADPRLVDTWRARLPAAEGLRVGVVWSGNPAQPNDRNRSMAFSQVLRIATPGVQLVNLQRDVRASDRQALVESGIWDPSPHLHSFSDTAALIESLDLVVSVCTGVAHLAGAMGKPLWVLLAHRPDWRWLLGWNDSPWYPTARLFRQPAPGAWDAPLDEVREALAQLADAEAPAAKNLR